MSNIRYLHNGILFDSVEELKTYMLTPRTFSLIAANPSLLKRIFLRIDIISDLDSFCCTSTSIAKSGRNYKKNVLVFYGISKTIYLKIQYGQKLSKDEIVKEPLSSLLRIASLEENGKKRFPALIESIQEAINYNPLPLKMHDNPYRSQNKLISFKPHQLAVLNFMKEREKCIDAHNSPLSGYMLNLEMGLGKTLITISHCLMSKKTKFPTLIVASKTVMLEWKREILKFFGNSVAVLFYHNTICSNFNTINRKKLLSFDLVITTYSTVSGAAKTHSECEKIFVKDDRGNIVKYSNKKKVDSNDRSVRGSKILFYTPWERLVFDESQRFSNHATVIFRSVMALYGDYKICLTGTPIRNSSSDLWTQFKACGYDKCQTVKEWEDRGLNYMENEGLKDCICTMGYINTTIEMPKLIEKEIKIDFSPLEEKVYKMLLKRARLTYSDMTSGYSDYITVFAEFTRLRKACICPHLLLKTKASSPSKSVKNILDDPKLSRWIRDVSGSAGINSSKLSAIADIVRNTPSDEKVLIFSSFSSCIDIAITSIGAERCIKMDGKASSRDRSEIIRKFNTGSYKCMFLTYKVGSEGLNLTIANHVICIEPWWCPAVEMQAISRSWRQGQRKPVTVYRVLINKSIEAYIKDVCVDKKKMMTTYINKPVGKTSMSASAIGYILSRQ